MDHPLHRDVSQCRARTPSHQDTAQLWRGQCSTHKKGLRLPELTEKTPTLIMRIHLSEAMARLDGAWSNPAHIWAHRSCPCPRLE